MEGKELFDPVSFEPLVPYRDPIFVVSVVPASNASLEDEDLSGEYPESVLPVVPASNASLEDEDLPGEDPVSLLLEVEVVCVLQEHLTNKH